MKRNPTGWRIEFIPMWLLAAAALLLLSSMVWSQESKVDSRVWSIHHWQKWAEAGLVEVAGETAVAPAQHTGSRISARTVLIDDSPDVPVTTLSNTTQSENSIFVNPLDNRKALNSNNSTDFPVSTIYGTSGFFTTDGGLTWNGSVQGTGGDNSGDPAAAIDLTGRYYVGYIADNGGQGVARSTNEGGTWTHAQVANAAAGGLLDKNHLWVDNGPLSAHDGNLYSAWTAFGGPNDSEIEISRSTNGGVNWSSPVNISSAVSAGSHNQGVNIQSGPNGEVYVAWAIYDSWPSDETAIGFTKSTDGGATYATASRIITNIRGIRTSTTSKNQRVASFPVMAVDLSGGPRNGWIYIVWTNIGVPGINTGDDIDNYIVRSTNGGQSWSAPIKVNQDPSGLGNEHYYPWITCDPVTGALSVVFYDDRNVGGTACEVFVANSLDGGLTWEDFKVSDVSFTPAPIPGLAGGYMGDYLGISARGGKVYPCWTDNRSGRALTYVSPFTLADPADPNAPANAAAYSDFTTPTSIALSWTDPTTYVNGTPLTNFTIQIYRGGSFLTSVNSGVQQYTNTGLTDGQLYDYTLYAKDNFDSLSLPVNLSWYAGGSPFPAAPANLAATADTVHAYLTWDDPTTQSDGTPLDDLDHLNVYRNDVLVASLSPGVQAYTDTPAPGFVYSYKVTAVDDEVPPNESAPSNVEDIYVGSTPDFLVWVGPGALGSSAQSGDSLFEALVANGESCFLTNNLFEFGSNLSVYEGIFVVLGIFSDNHVIGASDPEGPALEAYLQNGGRIYLEGADCYNYDPEVGGYNIRPWFGLNDGSDGSADVSGVTGLNDLSAFSFPYTGGNSFMDDLQPVTSTPVWKNSTNADISGVFNVGYGSGRSIGVVPSFGGLVDNPEPLYPQERSIDFVAEGKSFASEAGKPRLPRERNENFVKKAAWRPELKGQRRGEYFRYTAGGMEILANTKVDLMAAYLSLFFSSGAPQISVAPTAFADTLLQGASTSESMTITNSGGSLAGDLNFNITENPPAGWLELSQTSGTLVGNQSANITLSIDAGGLAIGNYSTTLQITSNDLTNPQVNVPVSLRVNGAPVVGFSPDSIIITLQPGEIDSTVLTMLNSGAGPLNFSLRDEDVFNAMRLAQGTGQGQNTQSNYEMNLGKGETDPRPGVAPAEGLGGPDLFGYRWIDSDEPGGPVFNWVDISATGTPLTQSSAWIPTGTFDGNDEGYIEVPLPFPFSFYGVAYTSAFVGSNGTLSFQAPTANTFTNQAIPTAGGSIDNFLAAFWDDMEVNDPSVIYYGTNGGDFVVQFVGLPRYPTSTPDYTFEYILKPSGAIFFQYLNMGINGGTLTSSSVGIENVGGTDGLQVAFNAAYLHNDLAIRFSAESAWLSQNPASGTVAAGGNFPVQVIADATNLTEGTYRAKIVISSNDPVTPEMEVPVKLVVQTGGCITGLLGDVTGDDAVNSTDGLIMLSYDAALPLPQPYLDRIAIGFGDVTEDGSTTSTDALVTLTWEAGLPVPFPVGTVVCLPLPGASTGAPKTPAAMGSLLKEGQAVSASALANVSQAAANQTITVPVVIDVAQFPGKLGSFTATLSWNPAELQFIGYRGGNSAGFENPAVNDSKTARGKLIAANANPHGGAGAVNVLNLEFKALANGAANVSLEFSAMAAAATFTDLLPYLKIGNEGSAAETENIPQSFAVDNYPNPFNPATTIRYQLPEAAAVQLVIYNVLGQQVRSLVNERREAGYHQIAWDGRNDAGAQVGSGIYIYRFEAGQFQKVQKMILMK